MDQRPARTPTGFYYPTNIVINNDLNWLACGSSYKSNTRHIGSDIICPIGTAVFTVGPGTVIGKSGPAQTSGWGIGNYALAILHSTKSGSFVAVYGHIQTSLNLQNKVEWGQQIGTIGRYYEIDDKTKKVNEMKPHLHFGVRPGSIIPASGWGRISDTSCKNANSTNGFVAPISWIKNNTPKG